MSVLQKAFTELKDYLTRKAKEEEALQGYKYIEGINERQSQIIKMAVKKPSTIFISKDLESIFNVSVKTIRSDLTGLVELGFFEAVPMNQRLVGYTGVKDLEEKLSELEENFP